MTGRVLLGVAALAASLWSFGAAGCLVTTSGGTGGAGGAGSSTVVGVQASSTTGGMDPAGCGHCKDWQSKSASLCQFNSVGGKSSKQLYEDFINCVCGADDSSGACGAKCPGKCKTYTQCTMGQQCINGALNGSCSAEYSACNNDK